MKNTQILLLVIFMTMLSTKANAQKLPDNREKTPFYYTQQIGVNYSFNENTEKGKFSDPIGVGGAFGFGKEFTPLWGWRAMLGYSMNRGRSSWHDDAELVRFHDLEVFVDGTLDLTDLWFKNRSGRDFNLKGFVGVGYLQTFSFSDKELAKYEDYSNESRSIFGFRLGLNPSYKIVDNFAVCADASLNAMTDNFNGVVNGIIFDMRADLKLGCTWYFNKKKRKVTVGYEDVLIANNIQPVIIIPIMAYVEPAAEQEKRRIDNGSAYLDFAINDMIINPSYRNNPLELQRIRESIDVINNDSLITINGIGIHGYASPEGSYRNNKLLALGRTLAIKEYLQSLYQFKESVFSIESTPEDWQGLHNYIEKSDLQNKNALLKIIDSDMDPDVKERKLRTVSGVSSYSFILKKIYPMLRHVDYTVNYTIRSLDVEEGRRILQVRPKLLSLNEMFLVANSYKKGTKEYKEAFLTGARIYPDNPVANLNAACVCIEDNDITQAKEYLSKAGDVPEAIHARGVIAVIEGDNTQARKLLMQSSSLGVKESDDMLNQLP